MQLPNTLRKFQLKSTPCRTEVLQLFFDNDHALSNAFIEKNISSSFDRVTVYRTLKSFEEKGLIHKVLDDNGITKYALCQDCSTHHHHHEHVHFKCETCGQTTCIESVDIPEVKLPKGYKVKERNLLIQGVCEQCI
ncbi:transcriptional repressor [Fulvivirga sp. RKSG066]|uniref:Fur family transcriptional regulator n=1 Tax=Fulvivirga aurantia TaxID=2529383 RepID=UPI0012BCFF6C|nr:transcriptional repressor [Fulvivirga aurantia]MTI23130.1 transcriptional repressor [Fulvivirga aurantia]